ncbi:DnaJ homolog subfamily C member 17 [Tanacetum coccineum]|uniref:DnaJ homolog subfamily C member 17 n=1 Tax=Tanacetum coccineum TaxID=301880 RepID=A0ABQ4Z5A9_9ASTR
MAVFINHYTILGFSSSEKGSLVSKEEIKKAYRLKALKLHPDKRLSDPNAVSAFQQLQASYEILKDDNARNAFDYNLIIQEKKLHREMTRKKMSDLKEEEERMHRKMMADLYDEKERKRKKMKSDLEEEYERYRRGTMSQEEKERARLLKEEVNRLRGMHANKTKYAYYDYVIRLKQQQNNVGRKSSTGEGLDKKKILRVYWAKVGLDCNEKTLRKIFETFGEVEDVVINESSTKKGSALVVMATKEGADIAVTGTVCGNHSNHLIVMPFQ